MSKFRYTRRPPSTTTFTLTDLSLPPGHMMGLKKRRDILSDERAVNVYCTCGWHSEHWHTTKRLAELIDYADHIKEVQKQGVLAL